MIELVAVVSAAEARGPPADPPKVIVDRIAADRQQPEMKPLAGDGPVLSEVLDEIR